MTEHIDGLVNESYRSSSSEDSGKFHHLNILHFSYLEKYDRNISEIYKNRGLTPPLSQRGSSRDNEILSTFKS